MGHRTRSRRRLLAVTLGLAGLTVATVAAASIDPAAGNPANRAAARGPQAVDPPDPGMVDAARAFLTATPGDRRGWGQTAFDDAERFNWFYTPVTRKGYALADMDETQRELAWQLVDRGLGVRGRVQARQIVTLEEILYERSGREDIRNPGYYVFTMFGAPGRVGRWAWRFEGHHLSLHFTLLEGRVVGTTPAFFGGNPAHVTAGDHAGLRPFAAEEERARELLLGLGEADRERAIFSATAPRDVVTGNSAVAARPPLLGLPLEAMDATARERVIGLIDLYASRLEPTLAAAELERIHADGIDSVHFGWAGGTAPGEPHYYRIQGPGFVIEYDNTQSGANHVHSVWRNFERDFGRDPLREHIAADHGPGSTHSHDD